MEIVAIIFLVFLIASSQKGKEDRTNTIEDGVGFVAVTFMWLLIALLVLQLIIYYWGLLLILLAVAGFSFLLYKYFKWKKEEKTEKVYRAYKPESSNKSSTGNFVYGKSGEKKPTYSYGKGTRTRK